MRDSLHETVLERLEAENVSGGRDRGMPTKEVVRIFGASEPTVRRYLRLRRETGDVEPKPLTGPPARKGAALEAALPAQAEANPEIGRASCRERVEISVVAVSLKKTRPHSCHAPAPIL